MPEPADPVTSPAKEVPAKRWPWHPLQAVVLMVGLFILSQLSAAFFLLGLQLLGGAGGIPGFAEGSIALRFLTILFIELFVVLGVYGLLRRHGLSLRAIGLARPRWRDAWLPFVAMVVYFTSFMVLVSVLSWLAPGLDLNQKQDIGFDGVEGVAALTMTFLALVVFAPVAEEVMFRGFLYTGLRRRLTFAASTLVTSLLFGAAHLMGGEQGASLLWVAGIDTMLLSIALCYLRESTGRLWAPILLHALKNSVAFTLLFVV